MSLFKWSTPERRRVDRMILPIIPTEIYIYIFEYIAQPAGRLTPEELRTFTNLSRVCRFFANFCLPRIFAFVEFSGAIFRNDKSTGFLDRYIQNVVTQIAAKQPLALALARSVRTCHFTNWEIDNTGSWAVRLFAKKYLAGMLHMKDMRELHFSGSFVSEDHWLAIATLDSLEELSFDSCRFVEGPADVVPEERVRIKVSPLRVINDCIGLRHLVAAVEPRCLRTLVLDVILYDQLEVDWLSQSALTELHIYSWHMFQSWYVDSVHAILLQAPPSVEALWLVVDIGIELRRDEVRDMFDNPSWKNLPRLRSLTLRVHPRNPDIPTNVLSFFLDCIGPLVDIQSLTLQDYKIAPDTSPTEFRRVLHDKLVPTSSLKHVDICGKVFRPVNGEWSEVS